MSVGQDGKNGVTCIRAFHRTDSEIPLPYLIPPGSQGCRLVKVRAAHWRPDRIEGAMRLFMVGFLASFLHIDA